MLQFVTFLILLTWRLVILYYRYKIYTEGWAWSVSEKYILACDSMTLYIRSSFYDFFIRGMVPLQHYWPIRENSKCKSLKFAVEWGNLHPEKVFSILKHFSSWSLLNQSSWKCDFTITSFFLSNSLGTGHWRGCR